MNRLYLLTGATGHLGSAILNKLLEKEASVRVLLLPHEDINNEKIEIIKGNVLDKASLLPFFNADDQELIFIHCAGIVSISSKEDELMRRVNVEGTKNVLDLSIKHNVAKFIYVSSVHAIEVKPDGQVMEEPIDFNVDRIVGSYAKTKAEASSYVLSKKDEIDLSIVFPSGITGPYDLGNNHLTRMIIDYYQGRLPFAIKGGYDFVDVRDVADGILSIVDKYLSGETFILSNRLYTVKEILDTLHEITNKPRTKYFLPIKFVRLFAPLMEKYYEIKKVKPLFTSYSLYTLDSNALFTHEKADRLLGYNPCELKKSLSDAIIYLKENKLI